MKKGRREKVKNNKKGLKLILVIFLGIILFIGYNKAPDYYVRSIKNKTNILINNNNVTSSMKDDIYIDEKDVVYLSKDDVKNFFDKYINYDENAERLITTSDTKTAVMYKNKKKIDINGSSIDIVGTVIEKDGKIYIPFSEIGKNVHNVSVNYIKSTDRIIIDSLDRELKMADSSKNAKVKYKEKTFSKTLAKIKKGEKITVISQGDKWSKIRTESGIVGYVKNDVVANMIYVRENMEIPKQINNKINLVWDYYSEYVTAPDREGENIDGINVVSPTCFYIETGSDGTISDNCGDDGRSYISWAHNNGYKVWPIVSNNSHKETTNEILNDYTKRRRLEDNIIRLIEEYNLDGINLDFEYMNQSDKDVYSRLVIELEPRIKDMGKVLSVDVTAPDGAENWSLCFDRNVIGHVADYIVFMAYDQYGISDENVGRMGTTAGYDWVEKNILKFIGQEEVDREKIILGIPLYTRLWKDENGNITSKVANMNNVDSVLPSDVERKWDDTLKQYVAEYNEDGATYKMWIEDEKSIKEKISLANKYNLSGIAFWEKDRETEGFWEFVDKELNN